jgi:hypothetical protein
MATGIWSETEPAVEIASVAELDRFVDQAAARAEFPVAVSVEVHGYRVDLLVGHEKSFVHLTPDEPGQPYYVTAGGQAEGGVDFWLHSRHHTWFEGRHLVQQGLARAAFREFFEAGTLSVQVGWEQYYA